MAAVVDTISATGDAATDVFTSVGHGLSVGQTIHLLSRTGGTGLGLVGYFVHSVPSADTFQISLTNGGSVANFGPDDVTASVFVPYSRVTTNTHSTTKQATLPVPPRLAAGDKVLVVAAITGNRTIDSVVATPSGSNLVQETHFAQLPNSDRPHIYVYGIPEIATPPSTGWTFTASLGNINFTACAFRILDSDPADLMTMGTASYQENMATTSITEMTGLAADTLVIGVIGVQHEQNNVKTVTWTAGWDEIADFDQETTQKDWTLALATKSFPAGGSTGALEATVSGTSVIRTAGALMAFTSIAEEEEETSGIFSTGLGSVGLASIGSTLSIGGEI